MSILTREQFSVCVNNNPPCRDELWEHDGLLRAENEKLRKENRLLRDETIAWCKAHPDQLARDAYNIMIDVEAQNEKLRNLGAELREAVNEAIGFIISDAEFNSFIDAHCRKLAAVLARHEEGGAE